MHPEYILRHHVSPITDVLFSSNNSYFASASSDGLMLIWDLNTRRVINSMQAHTKSDGVLALDEVRPEDFAKVSVNKFLLSHGRDGFIKLWDISKLNSPTEPAIILDTHAPFSFCKASFYDSKHVLAPSNEQSNINLWNILSNSIVQIFTPTISSTETSPGMCMAVKGCKVVNNSALTTSGFVFACYENGGIIIYDGISRDTVIGYKLHEESCLCIDIRMKRRRKRDTVTRNKTSKSRDIVVVKGVTGGADNQCKIWSFNTDSLKFKVENTFTIPNPGISSVSIRDDLKLVAAGCWDHSIRVFSIKNRTPLAVLRCHTNTVHAIDFSSIKMVINSTNNNNNNNNNKTTSPDNKIEVNSKNLMVGVCSDANNVDGVLASGSNDSRIGMWKLFPYSA